MKSRVFAVHSFWIAMFVMGFAASAHAGARMYAGSLIIHAFGNDSTTGSSFPASTSIFDGIPLAGHCNTTPYHARETVTFPTYTNQTQIVMWTIPKYGGRVRNLDTNGDTFPDIIDGCFDATLQAGHPLVGSGTLVTTGSIATSRTPMNPRGFSIPANAMSRVTSASRSGYGVYVFDVHYADLRNRTGQFLKSGGHGDFSVVHSGNEGTRKAVQTAGTNRFGGVMRLLGTYESIEGYLYLNDRTSVFKSDFLFDYLGHGDQALSPSGMVIGGFIATTINRGYLINSGYPTTAVASVEVFKWTTGTVKVTALEGTFPTVLERHGFDARTAMGSGEIQLVSPMLTRWVGAGETSTAAIGIIKVTFAPEPSGLLGLSSGVFALALLHRASRKR